MTYEFMLTVENGKKLIALGLMADPQFADALENRKVLIVAGTTNGYIAQRVLEKYGKAGGFDRELFRRGATVAPGAKLKSGEFPGDVLVDRGNVSFTDVAKAAAELEKGDLVLKGANAVWLANGEAGVLIGNPVGGTVVPILTSAIGHRAQIIVPAGLEKRIDRPISELCRLANGAESDGPRMAPLPGRVFTELDAVRALTGCEAALLASGGILGAEGCVYLAATGTAEQLDELKKVLKQIRE